MASGKRIVDLKKKYDLGKVYPLEEGLASVLEASKCREKAVESVDLTLVLGGLKANDPEHQIRTFSHLPVGLKKPVKILVFADGDAKKAALDAGADWAGLEDFVDEIKKGTRSLSDVDVVLAVPSAMRFLGKIGKMLGPKGLMPNAKDGTVTDEIAKKVSVLKEGNEVRYRADKAGVLHCSVGRSTFTAEQLAENVSHVVRHVLRIKPSTVKGRFLKKVFISSTMGVGFELDASAFAL
jgi:large subunit ribosomal protein L1